jgi:hypothetical protein
MRSAASAYIRQNAIALVALFFAVSGGTAMALDGSNTVFSDDIVNGQVRTGDMAAGAVTISRLANNAVNSPRVADDTLRSEDILDGEIRAIDVAFGTLRGDEILDGTIGGNDLVDDGVTGDDVNEATLFNDQSLTSADLGEGSVGTSELGAGSVGASELGDAIVDRQDPTPTLIDGGAAENGSYNTDQSVAACNAGEELIGGYGTWTDIAGADEEVFIQRVGLGHDGENVIVVGGNDSGLDRHLAAVATCLQP